MPSTPELFVMKIVAGAPEHLSRILVDMKRDGFIPLSFVLPNNRSRSAFVPDVYLTQEAVSTLRKRWGSSVFLYKKVDEAGR